MSCPFKPSDKVVALVTFDDKDPTWYIIGEPCVKDHVYVIERTDMGSTRDGLKLVGRQVFHSDSGDEVGWDHRQFRKLEEVQAENRLRATQEASA